MALAFALPRVPEPWTEIPPPGLIWGWGAWASGLSHLTYETTGTVTLHRLDQPPFPCMPKLLPAARRRQEGFLILCNTASRDGLLPIASEHRAAPPIAAASVGSLKNNDRRVVSVHQPAARNQLQTQARVGEGHRIDMSPGIEQLPSAGGPSGKLQRAVGLELRRGVFVVMHRHRGIRAYDQFGAVQRRVEAHRARRGHRVIATGPHQPATGRKDGKDQPGRYFQVSHHLGRVRGCKR